MQRLVPLANRDRVAAGPDLVGAVVCCIERSEIPSRTSIQRAASGAIPSAVLTMVTVLARLPLSFAELWSEPRARVRDSGEIALIRDVPAAATVRAPTALTLRGLSRATFVTAVASYLPSAHAVDDVIDGHLARFMPTQLA